MAFVIWDMESVCSNPDAIYIKVIYYEQRVVFKIAWLKKEKGGE